MKTREKERWIKLLIQEKVTFFDRVTIWFDTAVEFIDVDYLNEISKCKIVYKPMKLHGEYKQKLMLWQPKVEALIYLRNLLQQQPVKYLINYVEVAIDFITDKPKILHKLITNSLVFLPKTVPYFNEKNKGTTYYGLRGKHKVVPVIYSTRDSKVAEKPCCHFEYKHYGKQECINKRLATFEQLINFNFMGFFKSTSKFYKRPTKADVGLAYKIRDDKNVTQFSKRTLESYCNKRLPCRINLESTELQVIMQELPELKSILKNKKNQKLNAQASERMYKLLF
jgi:hypothetical protein